MTHPTCSLDSLAHLFPSNEMDPVYETIDHPPVIDAKSKSNSGNTFFSKTKDKFVTVVNKLVDNYGNVPKKPSATASTKRPAPIAEHILRQQAQAASPAENTYENTKETLVTTTTTTTPGSARRSSTSSSSIVPPAKNSVILIHRCVSFIYLSINRSSSFLPFSNQRQRRQRHRRANSNCAQFPTKIAKQV